MKNIGQFFGGLLLGFVVLVIGVGLFYGAVFNSVVNGFDDPRLPEWMPYLLMAIVIAVDSWLYFWARRTQSYLSWGILVALIATVMLFAFATFLSARA